MIAFFAFGTFQPDGSMTVLITIDFAVFGLN